MVTLTSAQAQQSERLTQAFKAQENREAAKIAAIVALTYQQRVNVENPSTIERWLTLVVSKLISSNDSGARRAAAYFQAARALEVPDAPRFSAAASIGTVDEGVRESLLTVGPYAVTNKVNKAREAGVKPAEIQVIKQRANREAVRSLAASTIRHAQSGSRQTIDDNARQDRTALGWIRVTKASPCYFCALLASRGVQWRPYSEGAFDESNARFSGDGNAKVHDECGCAMKPVWSDNDPLLEKSESFLDMWQTWGNGTSMEAVRNFRVGYEHFQKTGESLTPAQIAAIRRV